MITKDIFDIITKVASYGRTDYEPTPDEVFTALMHATGDIDYIDPYIHLISSYELATGRDIYNPQIYHECF